MGAWANDGGQAQGYEGFFVFNGRLFCHFSCGDPCRGIYERTAPATWTKREPAGVPSGIYYWCVWRNQLWVSDLNRVWRSADALTWYEDYDITTLGLGYVANIRAMNAYGSRLHLVVQEVVGFLEPTAHFARRSTAGVWTYDCVTAYTNPNPWPNALTTYDIIEYYNRIMWSVNEQGTGDRLMRWNVTAWEDDLTGSGCGAGFFHVHRGVLYISSLTLDAIWRKVGSGGWYEDFDPGLFALQARLSTGADGHLYVAFEVDAANIRPYARYGRWTPICVSQADTFGGAAIAGPDGDIFMCGNVNAYIYVPSFDVSPAGGGGFYPQAMDCDGDGNALYVCVYNAAAQPILVKAPLPLSADVVGAAVFNPAAGTAINVQCNNLGGQLAIAGRLSAGGNDSVQVSDDGALSWADIAPNWGDTVMPLALNPNDLDEILACLQAAQDVVWTVDSGGTWTVVNPAIGFSPTAMAKLPEGSEIVLGGPAGEVEYSPNQGAELANINVGWPAGDGVEALEVI